MTGRYLQLYGKQVYKNMYIYIYERRLLFMVGAN